MKEQLPFYALLVLCFFPVMPFGVMTGAIIVFSVLSVGINFNGVRVNFEKRGLFPLVMNIAFFLFLIITLLYSENLKFGWRQIERGLPLLLFPLIFLYFPPKLSKKKVQIVCGTFVVANLVFTVILYLYLVSNASDFSVSEGEGLILFEGLKNKGLIGQLTELWNGTFYEVLYYAKKSKDSFLEIHKTYAAQNILWCLVIVAFFSIKERLSPLKKMIQLLLMLILGAILLYLYSLMNLLLFALLSPLLMYAILGPVKQRLLYTVGSYILLIGIFLTATFGRTLSSESYEKYKQYENPLYVFSNIEKMFQQDERNTINDCNSFLIKERLFFGYGIGDVQNTLNTCYIGFEDKIKKATSIREQNLNSHNYYAFLALAGGITALVFFLVMIGYNTSVGLRTKDFLYLAFIFIIGMNLFTENILGRAHGILFFALFNSIFLSKNLEIGGDK